ncbi:hypothetical protein crov005 [Cafeteria roenbergensis virus]|uniref:Uncharacterized protein n=1 Tax=Cafeteria roenbergensis virus (strain BV-PW1) TaxID=693272 RepID=E3T4C5_CROVB|nr:hypothetical protein crov005 [Cafeteria roenbergensis virus BV-PW1]ADO67038.1 hypothetical protein crov005 [Cafeteria roenbergensis virus BV-PW1]
MFRKKYTKKISPTVLSKFLELYKDKQPKYVKILLNRYNNPYLRTNQTIKSPFHTKSSKNKCIKKNKHSIKKLINF